MRKARWWWITLLVAALVLWGGWQLRVPTGNRSSLPTERIPASGEVISIPMLNRDRLLADVKALSFVRHTETERDRARAYIVQALEQAGWQPQLQPVAAENHQGVNIVATRPGQDPSAGIVLLGAHYDTVARSPGADDNATSVATILEIARSFATIAVPSTLQLALFDLEEAGLVGSRQFAAQLPRTTAYTAALIMDMIGFRCLQPGCQSYPPLPIAPPTDRGDFLAVLVDQPHADLLSVFQPRANQPKILTLPVPQLGRFTPDTVRSDHAPFWRRGIGAFLVTDTANFRNPHYHLPEDTATTLDPDFFAASAQAIADATVRLLTQPPTRDRSF
ncbi:M28 family peptidase [Leptolyngbya sp. AN02str]|uniref:M28 family peptidase n=1 Tax=Leptolyngbya sp. AN02str TaxID=3423363 RepID=UPI003D319B41